MKKDPRIGVLWILESCRRVWLLIFLMLTGHSLIKLSSSRPIPQLAPLYSATLLVVGAGAGVIYLLDRYAAKNPGRWAPMLARMLGSRDLRLQQRAAIHIVHAFENDSEETLRKIDPALIRKAVLVGVIGPEFNLLSESDELEALAVRAGLGHKGESLQEIALRFKESPSFAEGLHVGHFQTPLQRIAEIACILLPAIAINVYAFGSGVLEGRTAEGAVVVLANRTVLTLTFIAFSMRSGFALDPVRFWETRQARPYLLGLGNSAVEAGLKAASHEQLKMLSEEAWAAYLANKTYRDDALAALIRLGDKQKNHLAAPYLTEDETHPAFINALSPARADA